MCIYLSKYVHIELCNFVVYVITMNIVYIKKIYYITVIQTTQQLGCDDIFWHDYIV